MGKKTKNNDDDRFVEIDIENIDEDLASHAGLRLKWGEKLADAKLDLAEAEAELELTKAEVDAAIRDRPKKYGLKNEPTEASIKQAIPQQQDYQDALSAVNKAQHKVNVIVAGCIALDHRKRNLSDLVTLISLEWFAEPKVKQQAKKNYDEMQKRKTRSSYRRKDIEEDEDD